MASAQTGFAAMVEETADSFRLDPRVYDDPEDFAAEPPVVAPDGLSFTAVPAPAPPPAPPPRLEPGRIGPLLLLRAFGGVGARLPCPCPEAATLMAVLRLAASTAE